jgi:hypothetical protein
MPDELDSLGHTLHDNHKASNKRRFILDQDAPSTDDTKQLPSQQTVASPLHVLAHAASTAPRLPISRRKRVVLNPPSPPPHVKKFNLLTGLVSHVDILLQITGYLPPQTLLDLYTISAPFHYVMDSHSHVGSISRQVLPLVVFSTALYRRPCLASCQDGSPKRELGRLSS